MENKQDMKKLDGKQQNCWKNTQIQELIKTMAIYFSDLEDYGKGINLQDVLQKYRIYFEKKYSVNDITTAIHKHCEFSGVVPKVCDLKPILQSLAEQQQQEENARIMEELLHG